MSVWIILGFGGQVHSCPITASLDHSIVNVNGGRDLPRESVPRGTMATYCSPSSESRHSIVTKISCRPVSFISCRGCSGIRIDCPGLQQVFSDASAEKAALSLLIRSSNSPAQRFVSRSTSVGCAQLSKAMPMHFNEVDELVTSICKFVLRVVVGVGASHGQGPCLAILSRFLFSARRPLRVSLSDLIWLHGPHKSIRLEMWLRPPSERGVLWSSWR